VKKVDQVIPRRETTLYTAEFRAKAVERFAAGKLSSPAFADSIGVNRETFRRWVKKARKPGQTVSSQVLALRAEVTRLTKVSAALIDVVSQLVAGKGGRSAK
jgi:transposase-like protein